MKKNKIDDRLKKLKKIVVPVLKRNNVVKAGIFGSFAIGRAKKSSDIDILIEVKAKKFSLFDMIGIELELKKVLGRNVDLLTYKGVDPLLKESILKEEIRII